MSVSRIVDELEVLTEVVLLFWTGLRRPMAINDGIVRNLAICDHRGDWLQSTPSLLICGDSRIGYQWDEPAVLAKVSGDLMLASTAKVELA